MKIKRKGNFETVAMAVVTFMLVGVIATLASTLLVDVQGIIRSESVDLAANRMDRAIYGLSSFEDAKLQLDYGRNYRLYSENRRDYIAYTFNEETSAHALMPYTRYEIREPADETPSRYFCLNKTQGSPVLIYAGRC